MRRKALIFICLLISALTLAVISSCDGGIFGASKYTVNFYDGTELLLSVSVFDTKNVSAPRLSDRDGYESNGFVGSDGVTAFGEDYPFVRGAANDFYAVWSKKIYNITYELNGGVNGDNPETYTVDDAFTLADAYKDGFEFIGWTCSFSRIPSKNLSVTRGTYGDLRFVANFIDENLYYLYFDALGGGALSPSVSVDGVFSSAPEPDREGYGFSGWYLDEEYLSAAVFPFCATEKVTTLYAKWQPKTYHIYSADGSFETVEYTVETPTFDLAKPNKTGYKFVGFSEAGKTEMTAVFTVTKGSCKDYTVSSHFVAIDYVITFNTLGGSEVDRLTANYLDDISAPTAPVKDNCDFIGWFEDELLSTPFVFDKMPAKSFTLYAGWHSDMNFSLNYTAEFSAATITSNKPDGGLVTAGENVCLCAPTYCDGGIFLFWETGGTVYSYDNAIDFMMPASNVSFYASYAELDTVSYNKDSGGDLEILFPSAVSALTGAGLKSSDYRCSSNKLTVYSSALCAFSAGYYPLSATTQNGSVYFALKVYATEKTIVGLSLDYDINYPSVSLVINGDKSASYEYSLDGAAFVPALEVTVLQGYDKSLAHTVTVRNVSDAQDRFTVSRQAAQNYEKEYLEDTFDYGGRVYDKLVESDQELKVCVEYAINVYAPQNISPSERYAGGAAKFEFGLGSDYSSKIFDDIESKMSVLLRQTGAPYSPSFGYSFSECSIILTIGFETNTPNALRSSQTAANIMQTQALLTNSTRASDFDDFKINSYAVSQNIRTIYELENLPFGVRPIIADENSQAGKVYKRAKELLRAYVDDNMSDLEKVVAIYDILALTVTYDDVVAANSANADIGKYRSFTSYGALIDGVAVCDGIAGAFSLLCGIEGIECVEVSGSGSGMAHAWNKVNISGVWYAVDPTWCHITVSNGGDRFVYVSHRNMLMDEETSSDNGHIENAGVSADYKNTENCAISLLNGYNVFINGKNFDMTAESFTDLIEIMRSKISDGATAFEVLFTDGVDVSRAISRAGTHFGRTLTYYSIGNGLYLILM